MRETFIRKDTHESSSRVPSRLYCPAENTFQNYLTFLSWTIIVPHHPESCPFVWKYFRPLCALKSFRHVPHLTFQIIPFLTGMSIFFSIFIKPAEFFLLQFLWFTPFFYRVTSRSQTLERYLHAAKGSLINSSSISSTNTPFTGRCSTNAPIQPIKMDPTHKAHPSKISPNLVSPPALNTPTITGQLTD